MSNVNRATIKTRNTAVSNGIDKHIPAPVSIGSVTYTSSELKGVFTAHNAALDAADALRKQWTDQVQVARAAGKKAGGVYLLLRSALIGQYGKQAHATLNDFGMQAPKVAVATTTKVKAEAVDKRAATRVARHTMGKVQRKAITGATAPATSPATLASPAAPMSPATSVSPATPTLAAASPNGPVAQASSPEKPAPAS